EAEKLGVQVIETSKTKFGADHPSTLTSTANLRRRTGVRAGEKLQVQVMETRKTTL
ncbi:hypothetical protein B0I37DRAFT_282635, partial [Chaetomium sp. MPI-CAGE-AT-0009]